MRKVRRLNEAVWREALHPRGRGGEWIDVLGRLQAESPRQTTLLDRSAATALRQEVPKPLRPGDKPTMFESKLCSKCGGEGRILTYANVLGGVCFKCQGRGRTLTPRGQKAQSYYRDLLSKRADQLQPGDKIWDEGDPMGFTKPGWKEVQSVIPEGDNLRISYQDASRIGPPERKYRVQHTLAEKRAAAEQAKAYQETLPKPKPRKPRERKIAKPKPATAKQMEFARKLAAEHGTEMPESMSRAEASKFIDDHLAKPKPDAKPKTDVIEGDATEIKGRVISASYKDSPYGPQAKMLIEDDRGFRVYGTLPRKLEDELSNRSQAEGQDWAGYLKKHPLRVRLTGGTKRSRDDTTFGFFSRPKNASFEDTEAQAETVADKLGSSESRYVPLTDEGIRTAAANYNADYPDVAEHVRTGKPIVRVTVTPRSRRQPKLGWNLVATPAMKAPDGSLAAAQDPVVVQIPMTDGRLSGLDHAKRELGRLGLKGAKVPVEFKYRGEVEPVQEAAVPYTLKGNSVIRADTGEVVKTHPTKAKALAHLRALKVNVEAQEAQRRALDEQAERWLPTEAQLVLHESEKTAGYAVTPHPFGKPGGPGLWKHKGLMLPPYIQNVAHGIQKSGKSESAAIASAIAVVKRWAAGGGNVHPEVKAAAAAALAQWEALKASHGGGRVKGAVKAVSS